MIAGLTSSTLRYFVVLKGNLKIAKMKKITLINYRPDSYSWLCFFLICKARMVTAGQKVKGSLEDQMSKALA